MMFWIAVAVIVGALLGYSYTFDRRRRLASREQIATDGVSRAETRRLQILTDPATVTAERFQHRSW